jgi:hypothetical protein
MHPELFKTLEQEAAQQVMKEWFLPYWELALSACKADVDNEYSGKAIELGKQKK